jgi:glutathione S-transferase
MSILSNLPASFGWSALLWVPGMTIYGMMAGGPVMKARKEFKVDYPNLYATPGHHDKADQFNAVQRGHQNFLEMNGSIQAMALFGSLYSENAAWANCVGAVLFYIGSKLYASGYATHWNVEGGRYKSGGAIKWIGFLTALVTSVMMGLQVAGVIA